MGFTIQSNDLAENAAIQSVWYDVDLDAIARAFAGVGVLTGCAVTAQGSPDMTVAVAAGTIRPSANAAPVTVSSGNVTVGAASGSFPRLDIISAAANGTKTITAGTAAASPKPPALPAGNIYLAMIYIPTSATTITTARITDKRCVLSIDLTTFVTKSADQNLSNSAVLANDSELLIALAANTTYIIKGHVWATTTAAGDFKFAFTGPASPTFISMFIATTPAGGSTITAFGTVSAVYLGSTALLGSSGDGINLDMQILIQNGANAGDMHLQWAQNTQTADAGVTVRKGSYFEYRTI